MTPSPIRAEYQRVPSEIPASSTASPAITSAMRTISPRVQAAIRLTMSPASSGVATPIDADDQDQEPAQLAAVGPGDAQDALDRARAAAGVTDGSRRNDRIAAMEVMLFMAPPPPSR